MSYDHHKTEAKYTKKSAQSIELENMVNNLTFITGNMNKLREVQEILPFETKHQKLDVTEIQTLDLEEISYHKAKEAFSLLVAKVPEN